MNTVDAQLDIREQDSIWQAQYEGFTVDVLPNIGPRREQFEQQLLESGVNLPLPHRSTWARAFGSAGSWFVGVRDASGKCTFGFAVEVAQSRALPGHCLLRVKRFGAALTTEATTAGLRALVHFSRHQRRILRLYVEVFSPDPDVRNTIASLATSLKFHQVQVQCSYRNTVVVDLTPDVSEIFSFLTRSARRNIRSPGKKGFETYAITDPVYAEKMDALQEETMARTGGQYQKQDWARIVEFSNRYPTLSRVVGTFRPDTTGPNSLVAFVWGCGHGDHATHTSAASTRAIDSNVPLSYAMSWDLICWAKRNGATWFDFGGITQGSLGDTDNLGGISDFKRFFSKQVTTVGDEWIFEPHPLRGTLARLVSAAVTWTRRF